MPVTPVPVAPRPTIEAYSAPHAPPIEPAMNGRKNRRLTPKMAGSVMPMNAESEAGSAMLLSFLFRVLSATASAAPPCATFAAEASGSQ